MQTTDATRKTRKAGPLALAAGLAVVLGVVLGGSALWLLQDDGAADRAGQSAAVEQKPDAGQGVETTPRSRPVSQAPSRVLGNGVITLPSDTATQALAEPAPTPLTSSGEPDLAAGLAPNPSVPSGQTVTLHEVLLERRGDTHQVVLRYVAPAIARASRTVDFDLAEPDMDALCATSGLAAAANAAATAATTAAGVSREGDASGPDAVNRILVTLMDRPVERGVADPSVSQFNNLYRPENGRCIWEAF